MKTHIETLHQQFHDKLRTLLVHAQKLINAAKEQKPYNEGLVCLLSDAIYELEETSSKVMQETDNEEISTEAKLVQNVLTHPVYPLQNPGKRLSLLGAARIQKETNDTSQIKEIILACMLDQKHTEVLIENLKEIYHSVDEELKNS
jgi:hypothetical protein